MALYAISDLHLSLSTDKPMDIFGGWDNHTQKLQENWQSTVQAEDTVVIPGDISWAMQFDELVADFAWLDKLPGKKLIGKGNHDYWWTTKQKLDAFLNAHQFQTISFMHNNSFETAQYTICGTRGWIFPMHGALSPFDEKIFKREVVRLEQSLKHAFAQNAKPLIVAMHYPPIVDDIASDFVQVMAQYGVQKCVYGHLHGDAAPHAFCGERAGIHFELVSCDFLKFCPKEIVL
ncbi:MAG: metallophosphoesterase [Hyphomonadaceae bacterium]|nr:metallophosphoesterase [Clostridia bacterium]